MTMLFILQKEVNELRLQLQVAQDRIIELEAAQKKNETTKKALVAAATDNGTTWDELLDEIQMELYEMYPKSEDANTSPITPQLLERYCLRFPQYEDRLRSYTELWNNSEPATEEAIAAMEVTDEEVNSLVDKMMPRTQFLLRYYHKLHETEERLKEAQAKVVELAKIIASGKN